MSICYEFCFEYGNINYYKNVYEKVKWFWGYEVIFCCIFFIIVVLVVGDFLKVKVR